MRLFMLMNPGSSQKFFEEMKPRGLAGNLKHLMLFGVFTFLGTFLLYSVLGFHITAGFGPAATSISVYYAVTDGLILALLDYVKWIISPLLIGILFSLASEKVAGRKVKLDESITIISYAFTPALIFNILTAFSLVGIFASSIGMLFTTFLVYSAAKARFKAGKKPLKPVVSYIFIGALTMALVGLLLSAVTPKMKSCEEITFFSEGITAYFEEAKVAEEQRAADAQELNSEIGECLADDDMDDADDCLDDLSVYLKSPEPCKLINDPRDRDDCLDYIAMEVEDPSICMLIADPSKRPGCVELATPI